MTRALATAIPDMIGDETYIAAVKGIDMGEDRALRQHMTRSVDTLVGSSMRNGHPVDPERFGQLLGLYAALAERRLGLSPAHARAYMGQELQTKTHAYVLMRLTPETAPHFVAKLRPLQDAGLYGSRMVQALMLYAMTLQATKGKALVGARRAYRA